MPEDSDMKGQYGPRTKDTVDKANELLDNLPFDLLEGDGEYWKEVCIGLMNDLLMVLSTLLVAFHRTAVKNFVKFNPEKFRATQLFCLLLRRF